MGTTRAYLRSMRLRTLPLSLAGIIMGEGMAIAAGFHPSAWTTTFLLLTTALLQILSNLSNELGDALHGTDSARKRLGMHYSIMDGDLSPAQIKRLVVVIAIACMASGLLMIYFSFGTLVGVEPLILIILGACAIIAAMRYTLGPNPYGYRGLGDIFVFIFFGLVSCIGAYFICSHDLHFHRVILPACAIGCFSVGVLNVNNIRDMKTDIATRVTTAIRLGRKGSLIYQTVLVSAAWALLVVQTLLTNSEACLTQWLFTAAAPLFALHLHGVWTRDGKALDPMLPLLVTSSFILSILYILSVII